MNKETGFTYGQKVKVKGFFSKKFPNGAIIKDKSVVSGRYWVEDPSYFKCLYFGRSKYIDACDLELLK